MNRVKENPCNSYCYFVSSYISKVGFFSKWKFIFIWNKVIPMYQSYGWYSFNPMALSCPHNSQNNSKSCNIWHWMIGKAPLGDHWVMDFKFVLCCVSWSRKTILFIFSNMIAKLLCKIICDEAPCSGLYHEIIIIQFSSYLLMLPA